MDVFNAAVFHATSENNTGQDRVAHLCQVSSGMSRSFEVVDRTRIAKAVWPVMKRWAAEGSHTSNDHADGHANGHSNGHANGHSNGQSNGTGSNPDGWNLAPLSPELDALLNLSMDDYGFPVNLERTSAVHGKVSGGAHEIELTRVQTPTETQGGLIRFALDQGWSDQRVCEALDKYVFDRSQ